ncbi:response regulator transcription factor [Methylocapsa palsarum]|uniref:DNA-binding response regulator, OmpR family, contains REC and winged-helix (WHTH) domain n=1 Tax=Methylocapsa palsarum TaxID=1612308 RepID=A0A1I3WAU4_9HYPH|nr:response regulator transcription factor [Methylocapsa palsarum]SFK03546.1 DNA-binding response regulator, OmpR family, contains REC and winged-helix (wHTH) domain [Methylocapsa palsarum]
MKILIVEDEPDIVRLLAGQLDNAGFDCDPVGSMSDALTSLKRYPYHLMLLDRRLPDGDSIAFLPNIRRLRPNIRILILSAHCEKGDKAKGLNSGADDYLTKPFDSDELLARVIARLRTSGELQMPPITIGAVSFDAAAGQIFIGGRPFLLHRREYALFGALMRRINRVSPREALMEEVYGAGEAILPGALDTLVSRLRKRLADAEAGCEVHLVRGRGYLLTKSLTS